MEMTKTYSAAARDVLHKSTKWKTYWHKIHRRKQLYLFDISDQMVQCV